MLMHVLHHVQPSRGYVQAMAVVGNAAHPSRLIMATHAKSISPSHQRLDSEPASLDTCMCTSAWGKEKTLHFQ